MTVTILSHFCLKSDSLNTHEDSNESLNYEVFRYFVTFFFPSFKKNKTQHLGRVCSFSCSIWFCHVNNWEQLPLIRVPLLYYCAGTKQEEVEMCSGGVLWRKFR